MASGLYSGIDKWIENQRIELANRISVSWTKGKDNFLAVASINGAQYQQQEANRVKAALWWLSQELSSAKDKPPVFVYGDMFDALLRTTNPVLNLEACGYRRPGEGFVIETSLRFGARGRQIICTNTHSFEEGLERIAGIRIDPGILQDIVLGQKAREILKAAEDLRIRN